MQNKILLFLSLIFVLFSCQTKDKIQQDKDNLLVNYAENFFIDENENGYCLTVKNRFNSSIDDTYQLSRKELKNSDINTIKIPIKTAICLSTTHCAFIKTMSETNSIIGISGTEYVYDEILNDKIAQKEIIEVGYDNQINYEKIISLKPDVVFAYSVNNSSVANYQKLIDIGIPVIFVSEFLESQPLGRSEWLKFFACFYDKFIESQEIFDSIANNYNQIKAEISKEIKEKPKVITGLPYKGLWWLPSKSSFFTNFIEDAGGEFIFEKENANNESIPLSMEYIFEIAKEADFWLNTNSCISKQEILDTDSRLKYFEAFDKAKIYNNFKRRSKNGGSDFWESGIVHPDIILSDLYSIFYNKNNDLFYYIEVE